MHEYKRIDASGKHIKGWYPKSQFEKSSSEREKSLIGYPISQLDEKNIKRTQEEMDTIKNSTDPSLNDSVEIVVDSDTTVEMTKKQWLLMTINDKCKFLKEKGRSLIGKEDQGGMTFSSIQQAIIEWLSGKER